MFFELKGGYDVAKDEEVFSFLLEDVLSFERGQEVADMISVFLDPDITVQPFNDDVSIRGIIELQGEYDRLEEQTADARGVWNQETFESRNYVDKVVDIGEERAIFSHQFPVEVTIPEYRVSNIEDVVMEIENFDYELMSPDQMNIQSSILIHGINQESAVEDARDLDGEEATLFTIVEEEEGTESRTDVSDTSLEEIPEVPEVEVEEDEHAHAESEVKSGQEHAHEESEVKGEQEHETLIPETKEKQLHISARAIEDSEEKSDAEADDIDEESEESPQDRNIDYLKSMFGGEEENGHTKVRLCIVQERDTVDSIAEKYDVKKSHILKKNHLEDEDLVEGQLLQIPSMNNS